MRRQETEFVMDRKLNFNWDLFHDRPTPGHDAYVGIPSMQFLFARKKNNFQQFFGRRPAGG